MAKSTFAISSIDEKFGLYADRKASVCMVTFGSHINPGRVSTYAFFETIKGLQTDAAFDYLLLRPRENSWYLDGIPAFHTGVEAAAEKLSAFNEQYQRTVYVGNSMGAYAALLYGLLSGAQKVVAISPQTDVSSNFRKAISETRWRMDLDSVNQKFRPAEFAIGALLSRNPNAKIDIDVHYGLQDSREVQHAEALAGDPRVHLLPRQDEAHELAHSLRSTGELGLVLKAALR